MRRATNFVFCTIFFLSFIFCTQIAYANELNLSVRLQNFRSDEAILIEQTLTYYPYIAQNEKVVDETGTARFSITGRGDWRIYRVVDGRKIYIMTIKATNSFDGAQNYNWVVTAEASGSASVLITKKSR